VLGADSGKENRAMVTRDVDDVHVSAKLSCNGHRRKFAPGIEGMD